MKIRTYGVGYFEVLCDFAEQLIPHFDKISSICSDKGKLTLLYNEEDKAEWEQHLFLYKNVPGFWTRVEHRSLK